MQPLSRRLPSDVGELLDFDRRHLWHPFTSMRDPLPVQLVESAEGCVLRLHDGREVVDGMASWWCAIHGYRHPHLDAAMRRQLDSMSHVMFGGLTHRPAVELGHRLVDMAPEGLEHVFFSDSGSVSVEVGMKMALQYWKARGRPGKRRWLTIEGGYHGDTFATMAVCDPHNGMHRHFHDVLPEHVFVPRPRCRFEEDWDSADVVALEEAMARHADELAAVILEPVVQGAGGMWFYHPSYLRRVRELCDQHGVLLLADEIATGFGRSGRLFACEHAGVLPDVMMLGKALTGGCLTLAATLCTAEVARGVSEGDPGSLMHGPTFMANPLATATAAASLELLARGDWQAQVPAIESALREGLAPLRGHPSVADVRVLGAIGVVEMREPLDVAAAQRRLIEQGVWLRPFGRLLYTMPPYVIQPEQLERILDAMRDLAAQAALPSS